MNAHRGDRDSTPDPWYAALTMAATIALLLAAIIIWRALVSSDWTTPAPLEPTMPAASAAPTPHSADLLGFGSDAGWTIVLPEGRTWAK